MRERDSTKQVRGSVEEVILAVKALVEGSESWESVWGRMKRVGEEVEGKGGE